MKYMYMAMFLLRIQSWGQGGGHCNDPHSLNEVSHTHLGWANELRHRLRYA
jgi:hypothetical protein